MLKIRSVLLLVSIALFIGVNLGMAIDMNTCPGATGIVLHKGICKEVGSKLKCVEAEDAKTLGDINTCVSGVDPAPVTEAKMEACFKKNDPCFDVVLIERDPDSYCASESSPKGLNLARKVSCH